MFFAALLKLFLEKSASNAYLAQLASAFASVCTARGGRCDAPCLAVHQTLAEEIGKNLLLACLLVAAYADKAG